MSLSRAGIRPIPVGVGCMAGAVVATLGCVQLAVPAVRGALALLVSAGAVTVAWVGVRIRGDRAGVARLLALAVTCWGAGSVLDQVDQRWGGLRLVAPGGLGAPDVAWAAYYVLLCAAAIRLIRIRAQRGSMVDGALDVGVLFTMTLFVEWAAVISTTVVHADAAPVARVVWALGPVADALMLAMAIRALIGGRANVTLAMLLGASAAVRLVAGASWVAAGDEADAWLVAGCQVAAVLVAFAVWQPIGAPPRVTARAGDDRRFGYWRIASSLVPLLLPGIFEIAGYFTHQDPNPVPLVAVTWVLVVLAFVRAARWMRLEARAQALVASHERFANAVAANSSDAVVIANEHGTIVNGAHELARMLGHHNHGFLGVDGFSLVRSDDVDGVRATFERALRSPGEAFVTDVRMQHFDGYELWASVRLVNLLDDPDVQGGMAVLHDITDRKRIENELSHQAFHDGLTGLPNRTLLVERIEQALRRNARDGQFVAVVFVDLDGFKNVNDSLGHLAGDFLLREAATRLTDCVRAGDTVARLGGDEFAILIERSLRPVSEAEAMADRVLEALSTPIDVGSRRVTVQASIGIASGDSTASPTSLLRDADVAMYRAKAAGKARWTVFDSEMRHAADERLQLESDLLGALDDRQMHLRYQPVVELDSGRVVGFEALIRWHHPTMGVIAPDRFIPIAEENGLIIPIGRWALREAVATAARWHRDHPDRAEVTMAVNVSARQIASRDLLADVAAVLAETELDPSTLVIEMTETAFVHDPASACATLRALRHLGVRLAIDDFGTGYSSLSYLRQFPVDILKIDRSFVNAITERHEMPPIVRGLIDLGRTLNLETIAEGVELPVQRDRLRDEHCQLAQGFLFARPLDADEAEMVLAGLAHLT